MNIYITQMKDGFIVQHIQIVNTAKIELTAQVKYDELTQKLEIVLVELNNKE